LKVYAPVTTGYKIKEIAHLTPAFDGGQCGPIQDRLRTIVAAKIATTQQQIVELMTLSPDCSRRQRVSSGTGPRGRATRHAAALGSATDRHGAVREC
jgi:hypothetical protein